MRYLEFAQTDRSLWKLCTVWFPKTALNQQTAPLTPALTLTPADAEELATTAVICDTKSNARIPNVLTRNGRQAKTVLPAQFLNKSSKGTVSIPGENGVAAYDAFTRLHGSLKLLADLLVSCQTARQLAGVGGDLLVYGQGGEEVSRLMTSLKWVRNDTLSQANTLVKRCVNHLDAIKPKHEREWRDNFSEARRQQKYLEKDLAGIIEPIQNMLTNADPQHVEKMERTFGEQSRAWVLTNRAICGHVEATIGVTSINQLEDDATHPQSERSGDRTGTLPSRRAQEPKIDLNETSPDKPLDAVMTWSTGGVVAGGAASAVVAAASTALDIAATVTVGVPVGLVVAGGAAIASSFFRSGQHEALNALEPSPSHGKHWVIITEEGLYELFACRYTSHDSAKEAFSKIWCASVLFSPEGTELNSGGMNRFACNRIRDAAKNKFFKTDA